MQDYYGGATYREEYSYYTVCKYYFNYEIEN